MNNSSDWAAKVARRSAGPGATVLAHTQATPPAPIDLVVFAASKVCRHPFTIFWVHDAGPSNFSWPTLTPAIVSINTRYLELIGTIRNIRETDILSDDDRRQVTTDTILRVAAELALQHGDGALACFLFVESIIGSKIQFDTPWFVDLESRIPLDEAYIPTLFYALAHEIGHVHFEHLGRQGDIDNDSIRELASWAVTRPYANRMIPVPQDLYGYLALGEAQCGTLRAEISADIFAARILIQATMDLMQGPGKVI